MRRYRKIAVFGPPAGHAALSHIAKAHAAADPKDSSMNDDFQDRIARLQAKHSAQHPSPEPVAATRPRAAASLGAWFDNTSVVQRVLLGALAVFAVPAVVGVGVLIYTQSAFDGPVGASPLAGARALNGLERSSD